MGYDLGLKHAPPMKSIERLIRIILKPQFRELSINWFISLTIKLFQILILIDKRNYFIAIIIREMSVF